MTKSKRYFALLLMVIMLVGSSMNAFASLGIDAGGKEILYIMDTPEVGSFEGNGQIIDIYNCTNEELSIFINDEDKFTLAPNGLEGSVLAYRTEVYSYVYSYEQGTYKLYLYIGRKGNKAGGNTSQSITTEARAAKEAAEQTGRKLEAEKYEAIAQESMTNYMQNLSEFEANRLKTEDAFIEGGSDVKEAMSNLELAEKYEKCYEDLKNNVATATESPKTDIKDTKAETKDKTEVKPETKNDAVKTEAKTETKSDNK